MNRPVGGSGFAADPAPDGGGRSPASYRTRIGRTYQFEAAHHLPLVPEGHRCRNMHGHTYRVTITVTGEPDARGFVCDFAEIDAWMDPLLRQVDHRVLNEVEGLENPTAEVIAAWFLNRIPSCATVRVHENDDCWAEVAR